LQACRALRGRTGRSHVDRLGESGTTRTHGLPQPTRRHGGGRRV